jgi:hypothetical protein
MMSAAKSTSPTAAARGLPISRTMIAANSSRRARCPSAILRTTAARSATGVAAHTAAAAWARATASSICASVKVS